MAGYGKTGKIGMLKEDRNYFGRHGFKRPQCTVEANRTINVGELSEKIETFVAMGFAAKEGDAYKLDLTEAGIDKLLGNGNIDIAVKVTVESVSEKAREKIEAAGGSIAE
jgi:large subunit ribosomal protein L15